MSRNETIKRLANSLVVRRDELLLKIKQAVAGRFEGQVGEMEAVSEAIGSEFQLAESELKELDRIDQALLRYRKKELGVCNCCGKNIPLVRMRAIPHADRCVPCQERAESGVSDDEPKPEHPVVVSRLMPESLSLMT